MENRLWLKRVLVPLWIVQMLVCVVFAAAGAFQVWLVDEYESKGIVTYAEEIKVHQNSAIQISFAVLTLIFDITEIVLLCAMRLGPWIMIVLQAVKSIVWGGFFILVLKCLVEGNVNAISTFLVIVLFAACIAQLLYAAVFLRRYGKATPEFRQSASRGLNNENHATYGVERPPSYPAALENPFQDPSQASLPYIGQESDKPTGGVPQAYELQKTRF